MRKLILTLAAAVLASSAYAFEHIETMSFDNAASWAPAQIVTDHISGVRVESDRDIPGSDVKLYLRGLNSFRTDSQPLWIIDGVIVESELNSLSWLNPEDIKSMTVVKDMSAAAIYGAQAANGVILISTFPKKDLSRDFEVKWTSNIGINPRFSHNHNISLTGKTGKTVYSVSGFLRMNSGQSSGDTEGGGRVCFETVLSKIFKLGSVTNVSFGKRTYSPSFEDEYKKRGGGTALYLDCNILPTLDFRLDGGVDLRSLTEYLWYGNNTPEGLAGNGDASIYGTSLVKYNVRAMLNWHQYFASDHKLTATAVFDFNGTDTKYSSMSGTDFFTHQLKARGISLAEGTPDVAKHSHVHTSLGGYFTFGYTFRDIVGADITLRLDRTPRYDDGVRLNKAGNIFVDLHNALFPEFKAVSALRLTAGYGEAGREQYVPYFLYPQYLSGTYPKAEAGAEPFYEGLCRARSAEFNAGIELGFIQDRINFSTKYYDKRTNDSFYGWCFGQKGEYYWDYAPRSEVFSRSSLLSNRGFEFDLAARLIQTKKVSWTIDANASWNVNQFLRVDPADASGAVLGRSVSVDTGFLLDSNGTPIDVTGDGVVNSYDMVVTGDRVPAVMGGLGTNLRVGRFYLDLLAGAAVDYYFRVDRVTLGYSFLFKETSFLKELDLRVNAYPSWKSVLVGVTLDF